MTTNDPEGATNEKLMSELRKDDLRLDEIKEFRRWSRCEADPNGIPVIVISEVRKGDDSRRELTLDDIKGSGRIGFDVDTALLLWAKAVEEESVVPVTLAIRKVRELGTRGKIELLFHFRKYRFEEAEASSKKKVGTTPQAVDRDHFDPAA